MLISYSCKHPVHDKTSKCPEKLKSIISSFVHDTKGKHLYTLYTGMYEKGATCFYLVGNENSSAVLTHSIIKGLSPNYYFKLDSNLVFVFEASPLKDNNRDPFEVIIESGLFESKKICHDWYIDNVPYTDTCTERHTIAHNCLKISEDNNIYRIDTLPLFELPKQPLKYPTDYRANAPKPHN